MAKKQRAFQPFSDAFPVLPKASTEAIVAGLVRRHGRDRYDLHDMLTKVHFDVWTAIPGPRLVGFLPDGRKFSVGVVSINPDRGWARVADGGIVTLGDYPAHHASPF